MSDEFERKPRQMIVKTAQVWFDQARNSDYAMAERLLCMENALNHTENALIAALQREQDRIKRESDNE